MFWDPKIDSVWVAQIVDNQSFAYKGDVKALGQYVLTDSHRYDDGFLSDHYWVQVQRYNLQLFDEDF